MPTYVDLETTLECMVLEIISIMQVLRDHKSITSDNFLKTLSFVILNFIGTKLQICLPTS